MIFISLEIARMFTVLFMFAQFGITSNFNQIITKHCPHTRAQFHQQFSTRLDYRLKLFPELLSNIFIFRIIFTSSLGGSLGYGVEINISYTSALLMYPLQWYVLITQFNISFRVMLKRSTCNVSDQYKTSPLSSLQNLSNHGCFSFVKTGAYMWYLPSPPLVSNRISV